MYNITQSMRCMPGNLQTDSPLDAFQNVCCWKDGEICLQKRKLLFGVIFLVL